MNGVHRNARIGHLAWGGFAALCLVLFVVARQQERAALNEQVGEAERRAQLYADTVLAGGLEPHAVSAPLTGATHAALQKLIEAQMLGDPRIARVRLWAPSGTLLFSSTADERGKTGRLRVNEDPAITAATGGTVSSRLATAPAPGDPGAETDLLETFLPLRIADRPDVLGAVQIDQYYAAVRSTAATEASKTAQWTYLGLAGLFGVLTALSFRSRPSEADAGWTRTSAPTDATTAGLTSELEELTSELGELTSRNEELTSRNEELTSRNEELTSRNERLGSDVDALRVELAAAATAVEDAERTAADAEEEAARALEVLEARVIAAEDRAAEAERRLAELGFEGPPVGSNGHSMPVGPGYATLDPNGGPTAEADVSDGDADDGLDEVDTRLFSPVSAEAAELRARLARNAARRKRSADS